jgi:protein-S-isoprenylcysteine O-methyltransferase Ste14
MRPETIQKALASGFVVLFFAQNAYQERGYRRRQIDPRGALPISRLPFVAGKLAMIVGWLGIIVQSYLVNLRVVVGSPTVIWSAVGLEALAVALILLGYAHLGDGNQIGLTQSAVQLRVTGIYRLTRNPIYVGFHLLTVAAVLYTLNPAVLLLGMISIGVHHAIVLAEEAHLESKLGASYREYRASVRRYL